MKEPIALGRPIRVLLVEDNPADADLARETLEAGSLYLDLQVAVDGVEALDYLCRRGRYTDARTPDLILLDLNLPRLDGRKVIESIRSEPHLKKVPIIVLTSSDAEKDVVASYELGANCYLTKPVDLALFQEIIRRIEGFWLTVVKLPPGE